ncbi:MAG: lipopolysaccharide biosynthesis protein, partial [Muribaculaceae bacterium]|nr:lipopolysaccharide biosynthesis protein [Muribaculaceae bacterium]
MSNQTLKQRTISGMVWVGIQKFGILAITFLSNIILARLLTPDDYGMIGILTVFIAVSNTFVDGGFGSALIQKTNPTQSDYTTVFYWNIILSCFLYVLLYIIAPWIETFYHNISGLKNILRVQGIVIIINALTIVQFTKLRKAMQFKLLARLNVYSAISSVLIAIFMAYKGYGVWALVMQQITLSIANVVLLWYFYGWKPTNGIKKQSIKELFSFGSFIFFANILNTIGNNINSVLIGKFFSASTLGYFTQAKKIEDVSSLGLLAVVEQVTYPMLVEVKDNFTRMARILEKFNNILLAITMPLMYCIFLLAKPIILFLFSEKWLPSVPMLQIMCIYGIFICMQGSNYNAIAAIGKSRVVFNWTIIKRSVNVAILLIMLSLWDFTGFLWGIVINAIFITFCNMYLVAKYIRFRLYNQIIALIPICLITTFPFIICYVFYKINILNLSYNYNSFLSVIIYLIIYLS